MKHKTDPNYIGAPEDRALADPAYSYCRTPLGEAVFGYLDPDDRDTVISLLLDYGADPNQRDRHGRTALGEALTEVAVLQRPNIVRLLLSRGADPNLVDHKGVEPLRVAVYRQSWYELYTTHEQRLDIIDMLVKAGAEVRGNDAPDDEMPLEVARTIPVEASWAIQDLLDDL